MKLRMHHDSIRLRLSADEVKRLVEKGSVQEEIVFSPGRSLTYVLRQAANARQISAALEPGTIAVDVPKQMASAWAGSDEVGLCGEQSVGNGKSLKIVVEKEFECLHGPKEAGRELFPNPARDKA